ncbi:MAG: Cytochrome c [Gemmataceae bacterium]|nr:Cytochrome c [Gemmataceae bacterium]
MSHTCSAVTILLVAGTLAGLAGGEPRPPVPPPAAADPPVSSDPRLVVELFAAAPDIVHPIAADFDSKGRLLVVESHTHFRPAKYDGPAHDRIRVLEDTDGDGKADTFTTFFEGTTATMDVAAHPDGSVYVATRNEILRLRDTNGDGKADEKTRIAVLETAGNYPHNGLSGLTFDTAGNLFFGMGENLGAPYKLIAADGTTLAGGGEGGNIFHCTAAGGKLRRVATGFWNPFGAGRDIFGRLFVVDNDPDASPPCRLVHVVEGADFGFQFRYGRSGRHPFQSWNGELPGTLPYVTGTGESPCEVVSYESDGLPPEYRGSLLVPAWADHRVERYVPASRGASVTADRTPFVQGGKEFRPSGLAVATDGSLFVSDWVSRSYELHGKGAVWHVRWKDAKPAPRPTDPKQAVLSPHRPVREAAARTLARDPAGREFLRGRLGSADVRVRAAALAALIDANDEKTDLAAIARTDQETGLREMAVRALVARGGDVTAFAAEKEPAGVRAEAVAGLPAEGSESQLLKLLADPDPFLRHAAGRRLARAPDVLARVDHRGLKDPKQRVGVLLAWRASGRKETTRVLGDLLTYPDPDVRFMAVKWVADEKLAAFRPQVAEAVKSESLDPRGFLALTTALARIDEKPVNDDGLAGYFIDRLTDRNAPASARLMALRVVPAAHGKLKTDHLTALLSETDPVFRVEVLRALKDRGDAKAAAQVRAIVQDERQAIPVRAQAILTLSAIAPADVGFLTGLANGSDAILGREALRALYQADLSPVQQGDLAAAAKARPDRADLAARVLGKPFHANRPAATDTDAWLKRLDGPADPDTGRRVFENPRLATCSLCHRVDGRGADVGPDLSLIGRTDRRWIVESILQPSAVVAPHYLPWKIETTDGRVLTGLLVGTHLDESVYVDQKGLRFKVDARDVASAVPTRTSIMPDGLLDRLTDQEVRDLVAYLASRK